MAIRISVSFSEQNVKDIEVLEYLNTKRSKSIFIKELIENYMEEEKKRKNKDS